MSAEVPGNNPEFIHQHEVQQLAERAEIDPVLLAGARYETLHQEAATFDVNQLQDINGEGVVALIGVGESALRLYALGPTATKSVYLTPGKVEEHREGKQQEVNMVAIRPGDSLWIGRGLPNKTKLGLTSDLNISRSHLSISYSSEGQLRIIDGSSNGTQLITKEAPRPKLDQLMRIPKERYFGQVVVKGQLNQPE